MSREITTRVKRMNIMRDTTSYGPMVKTDFTTILELEGSLPIDISQPIIICQEENTND